ncbi:MAG: hypothetical protein R3B13_33235 [Polyangiaceae bacterium]
MSVARAETPVGLTNVLLPGLYAWVATVALVAYRPGVSTWPRVLAMLALVALVAGPLIAMAQPLWGRRVGVFLYLALCTVTWLLASEELDPVRLEPIRAASGAIGWALFAFGWGSSRKVEHVPEDDPNAIDGPALQPRAALPRGSWVMLLLGLIGALVPILLAWRVRREDHAILAHAVSFVAAVALVSTSAKIALIRGTGGERSPAQRLSSGSGAFMFLTLALALGLVWSVLRK